MRLRKILLALLFIILLFASASYAYEYKSEVRVGLKYGNSAGNSFTVSSPVGLSIYNAVSGEVLYTAGANESVYIEMGSTGFSGGDKFVAEMTPQISVQSPDGMVLSDGVKYRGYILAQRQNSGEMTLINVVGTEDYVASVLGKEMSYTWPKEALKAQAVCARNFVLCRGNSHKNYDFDVCSTTHCQVYGGVASEHENTRQAVEETKGVLAKYNGEIVPLYFFATSSGHTENSENVWGGVVGYLKGVEDKYENPSKASKYKWSVNLSKSEIESKLSNAGVNIGTLENITVDSVTDSGRVTRMTFHGTSSTYTTKLEKCRTILGLSSQKFTITGDKATSVKTTAGSSAGPFSALSGNGISKVSSMRALSGNGTVSEIKIDSAGSQNYAINGGGYGHGVGMSQWGARGMAESGFAYDEILTHYFTNITLGE